MPIYPMMQVDAFTTKPLHGNPCAVIFDTDDLDEQSMLALAREMNLSETAFVRSPSANQSSKLPTFEARYFTPAEEIPMAGHPTIATTFALVNTGRLKLTGSLTRYNLLLQVGLIHVEILAQGEVVRYIVMTQKKPQFLDVIDGAEALPVFGLTEDDSLPGVPIQVVSTGTPQLMIPLKSQEELRRANVDLADYSKLRDRYGFFSPHLFCLGGVTKKGDTFARHLGTPPDLMEDPFTGSATGGMAAYLWRYNLIPEPTFTAEQGHWLGRPGEAIVEIIGPREDIQVVKVGGAAVAVMHGTLTL
jgi:trans-2,3-dihydro-3-hydroxyanthranilate isomerase